MCNPKPGLQTSRENLFASWFEVPVGVLYRKRFQKKKKEENCEKMFLDHQESTKRIIRTRRRKQILFRRDNAGRVFRAVFLRVCVLCGGWDPGICWEFMYLGCPEGIKSDNNEKLLQYPYYLV